MKYIIKLILIVAFTPFVFSQESHWNKQLLEQTKGKKIIRWERQVNYGSWTAILKVKKTGVYSVEISEDSDEEGNDSSYVYSVHNNIKPKYEQIEIFKPIKGEDSDLVDELQGQKTEVAEARVKKKTGIIVRYGDDYDKYYLDAQDFFQSIYWEANKGTYVPVKNNDMWGIYDWFKQVFIFECQYATIDDLPKTTDPYGFNQYSVEIFGAFNKEKKDEKIDLMDMDGNNGDGLFKARSQTTQKWGLYQYLGDEIVEAIPMKYDSLYHFSWNGNYTAVFNEGKVGFYLSYWSYDSDAKESVPCIYEDYKRYITDDQIPKLAVMKDGKWGWVDWLTGEEKSEFKYETPEDLPYPYYNQEIWLEE
ncbi:MAG: hypothetical protein ACI898_002187 [Flavobacteriales bacterium]|jgi:hypothetical protein